MRSIYEDLAGLMRLLGTAALSLVFVGSLVVGQAAWSEEAEEEDEEEVYTEDIYLMEEAIVVGSRHAPRSEKDSAAPVDVLECRRVAHASSGRYGRHAAHPDPVVQYSAARY